MARLTVDSNISNVWLQVAVAFGRSIYVFGRKTVPKQEEDKSSSIVSSWSILLESTNILLKLSECGRYLVACGEDKKLSLFDLKQEHLVGERVLPKRPSAICFTAENEVMLMADKSGEVNGYYLPGLEPTKSLLLGHSSIVLDLTVLTHQDTGQVFVASCDRDEKIRISHYPNGYNIHTFCLYHKSFVSVLCCVRRYSNYLISGGGDGLLCVWDWFNGNLLHSLKIDQDLNLEKDDPSVVTGICELSSPQGGTCYVAVITNRYASVCLYELLSDGILKVACSNIVLSTPAWCIDSDKYGQLWVCLKDTQDPVRCYKWVSNQMIQVTEDEESILPQISKWEYAKDAVGLETDWSELRKHDIDNMTAYMAKKEERIQLKYRMMEEDTGCVEEENTDGTEDENVECLSKRVKLEEN